MWQVKLLSNISCEKLIRKLWQLTDKAFVDAFYDSLGLGAPSKMDATSVPEAGVAGSVARQETHTKEQSKEDATSVPEAGVAGSVARQETNTKEQSKENATSVPEAGVAGCEAQEQGTTLSKGSSEEKDGAKEVPSPLPWPPSWRSGLALPIGLLWPLLNRA